MIWACLLAVRQSKDNLYSAFFSLSHYDCLKLYSFPFESCKNSTCSFWNLESPGDSSIVPLLRDNFLIPFWDNSCSF